MSMFDLDKGEIEIALINLKDVMRNKWDITISEAQELIDMLENVSLYAKLTVVNIKDDMRKKGVVMPDDCVEREPE